MKIDTASYVKVWYIVNRTVLQFSMLPVTKDVCINLIKVNEFNLSILVISVNHCFFRILTTAFQNPPPFCLHQCIWYCTLRIGKFLYNICMCNNIIGLLNWYWWILAHVCCENAGACECILKPTSANIHQYQFNNSFII